MATNQELIENVYRCFAVGDVPAVLGGRRGGLQAPGQQVDREAGQPARHGARRSPQSVRPPGADTARGGFAGKCISKKRIAEAETVRPRTKPPIGAP